MMGNRRLWTVLVGMVLTIAVLCLQKYLVTTPIEVTAQVTASPVRTSAGPEADLPTAPEQQQFPIPQVDGKTLFAHVQALSFRRYEAPDRAQARQYIVRQLEATGWKPALQAFSQGVNIVAQRPGTDPEAGTILVGAHYDTVEQAPGADDNASGVAVALEIARLFGDLPTPRTLQIVLFDREERGLDGSRAFTASDDRITPLKGAIIMDMVAYTCQRRGCQKYPDNPPAELPSDRGDFLVAVVDQEHAALLEPFQSKNSQPIANLPGLQGTYQTGNQDLPPLLAVTVPFKGALTLDLLRSDHAPFWYRGVGAILLTDTANFRNPNYHQAADRPGTIDRQFLTQVAQLVVTGTVNLLSSVR
ncbi:hypothetical protein BST81_19695 [Leptolyngbya sp. 'hensonii']|uniref:M28 family peptidase n=1 Tax=Leptolyngbya sp. 'hensonii' TaxID=1922337 RepID=UPI00094FE6F8|nr:M28 family peptidase [Leptolyngbya sp. 'hensonii']OLP16663.1 hypothetical protein BST81_19695 [Leptolyngbya sp. 'hensonii']